MEDTYEFLFLWIQSDRESKSPLVFLLVDLLDMTAVELCMKKLNKLKSQIQ